VVSFPSQDIIIIARQVLAPFFYRWNAYTATVSVSYVGP